MGEPIAEVGDLAGICGHNGTTWEKILIDADKRVVVALGSVSVTVEVVQDTPGDLLIGQHQYDGTTWRKSNLLWGYHDTYLEAVTSASHAGGVQTLNLTAVAAGYVRMIQAFEVYFSGTSCTLVRLYLISGANSINLINQPNPVSGTFYNGQAQIAMKEGDYLSATFSGLTANDFIRVSGAGYDMKINM